MWFLAKQANSTELIKVLREILSHIKQVVQDPRSAPQEAFLLLAIFVVVILIFVVLLLLVILVSSRAPEEEKEKADKGIEKTEKPDFKGSSLTFLAIVFILTVAAFSITSQPRTCTFCHPLKTYYEAWKESPHAQKSCLSCHAEPGILGYLEAKQKGLSNAFAYLASHKFEPESQSPDKACLNCHSRVREKTSSKKVRMSHREVIEGGLHCYECHPSVGHQTATPTASTMEKCLSCHQESKASPACSTCHPIDIAYQPHLELENYRLAHFSEDFSCRGCHSKETDELCFACHLIEMPHPTGWEEGKHAKPAFQNKWICYRCHARCRQCHERLQAGSNPWYHGDNWLQEHRHYQPSECEGCHRPNLCQICHAGR